MAFGSMLMEWSSSKDMNADYPTSATIEPPERRASMLWKSKTGRQ